MSHALIELLCRLPGRTGHVASGEPIFRQGSPVRVLHQILAGEVHLFRIQPNGAQLVLQRARAGAILAEASLFSEHYHCDAVAVLPTRTRTIDRQVIHAAFEEIPKFAAGLAAHLANEVQKTRLRAEILSLRTVSERLDAWISANEGRCPIKGEWKFVASEIGISSEALYREMAKRRQH